MFLTDFCLLSWNFAMLRQKKVWGSRAYWFYCVLLSHSLLGLSVIFSPSHVMVLLLTWSTKISPWKIEICLFFINSVQQICCWLCFIFADWEGVKYLSDFFIKRLFFSYWTPAMHEADNLLPLKWQCFPVRALFPKFKKVTLCCWWRSYIVCVQTPLSLQEVLNKDRI